MTADGSSTIRFRPLARLRTNNCMLTFTYHNMQQPFICHVVSFVQRSGRPTKNMFSITLKRICRNEFIPVFLSNVTSSFSHPPSLALFLFIYLSYIFVCLCACVYAVLCACVFAYFCAWVYVRSYVHTQQSYLSMEAPLFISRFEIVMCLSFF